MPTTTDSRRPSISTTPLFAVVGATDFAVERVRAAAANAAAVQAQFEAKVSAVHAGVEKRVTGFDPKTLRSQAQEAPIRAAARALEVAGKAEVAYGEFAERGKQLIDRVRTQTSTQDLVAQAGNTLNRGRAAVNVARKAADGTASALLGTLTVGRREVGTVIGEVVEQVDTTARQAAKQADTAAQQAAEQVDVAAERTVEKAEAAAQTTAVSARKVASTTRRQATGTRSVVKGASTSAARTTSKTGSAAKAAAKKVGD